MGEAFHVEEMNVYGDEELGGDKKLLGMLGGNETSAQKIGTDGLLELSKKGYQLLRENSLPQARDCFNKILETDDTNSFALVGLGDIYKRYRDFNKAIHYYELCLRRYPENNYALFGAAECYKNLEYYNKAIELWERYLQFDRNNASGISREADCYRKLRNFNKAKDLYEKVLQLKQDNPYAIIGLGHLYYDFKDYEAALSYW